VTQIKKVLGATKAPGLGVKTVVFADQSKLSKNPSFLNRIYNIHNQKDDLFRFKQINPQINENTHERNKI